MSLKPVSAEYLKSCVAEVKAKKVEEHRKLREEFFQRILQKAVVTANHGNTSILVEYTMATIQETQTISLPIFWLHGGSLTMTYQEFYETIQGLFPGCTITKGQTPLKSTWCLTIDWS